MHCRPCLYLFTDSFRPPVFFASDGAYAEQGRAERKRRREMQQLQLSPAGGLAGDGAPAFQPEDDKLRARIARLELELLASQADAQRLEDELKSNARAEATAKQWRDRRETEAARLSRNTLPLFTMDWMLSQPDEKIRLYTTMKFQDSTFHFPLTVGEGWIS